MDAFSTLFSRIFLAPQFFWFLALIPVVVLLYLLKLRRTEIVISSTYLWIKSLHDMTANAPFQKLRRNLLLLLQVLVLLFLVVAMARPFVRAEGMSGTHYGVIIDRSASMQTVEENGETRLDIAKRQALEMVDALRGGDKMMVVSFAESAAVLAELTDDRFRLRHAIESIEASDTRTNIRDVLLIAASLAPDNPDRPAVVADLQLVLLSDGKLSDLDAVGARAVNMTYWKVGETGRNAGIVGFSVRDPVESAGDQQTFVLVRNEDSEPLNTTLTLYFEDSPVAVEEVAVAAHGDREVIFAHPDFGSGVLKAALDVDDALPTDNTAWLALRPSSKVKVLVVGDASSTSSYYLKRALAMEPRVDLSAVEPADYARSDDYDLTIFDGWAPSADANAPDPLPLGTLLFFSAAPPIAGLGADGELAAPPVLAHDADHPAMRFLNPDNVRIQKALKLVLPDGSREILSTRGAPLIADVSRGGRQILVVAFDIADSNWPLRLSFPLFMQNVVSWAPRASLAADTSLATGAPLPLFAPADANGDLPAAVVTLPDGTEETVELDPARPVFFGGTERAGVYSVRTGAHTERFAVNLLDRRETSVTPTDSIQFGRGQVVAERRGLRQTRELWRWFIVAALGILCLEWWIYSRRAWA